MSLERVLRILESFRIARISAEVYIYLAKKGPQKGRTLSNDLRMTKQQLYPILKSLQEKRIVTTDNNRPALFSALAFGELLDLYVKINLDQAQIIKETKEELLNSWKNLKDQNNN